MSWLAQPEDRELPHSWRESDRFIPRVFVRPTLDFLRAESAGAVVMLVAQLARHARPLFDEIERAAERRFVVREYERVQSALWELNRLSVESASPLERMVRMISLPVTFLVVPVFALANAGIPVGQEALSGWWQDPMSKHRPPELRPAAPTAPAR